jgi:hypothetical protein
MFRMDRRLVRELIVLAVAKAAVLAVIYVTLFAPNRIDPASHIAAALFSSPPVQSR